jgi:hypothetical protein
MKVVKKQQLKNEPIWGPSQSLERRSEKWRQTNESVGSRLLLAGIEWLEGHAQPGQELDQALTTSHLVKAGQT